MIQRLAISILALSATTAFAEEKGLQSVTLRVTGLFEPGRESDLRAALEKVPNVALVSIDLEHGEGVFSYDPGVAFKDTKPDKIVERLNEWLRNASRGMYGVGPQVTTSRDKLTRVEVNVVPIDCQACALGLYEIVIKVDGVAQAMVSRKDGRISALIDPEKTSRGALEETLKKREVRLKAP